MPLFIITYVIRVLHLANIPNFINVILLVLIVWWFIEEGIFYFLKNRTNQKIKNTEIVYNITIGISILSIVFGALLKIIHWPGADYLLVVGLLLIPILLIVDYFIKE